jgi:hypothetical protein
MANPTVTLAATSRTAEFPPTGPRKIIVATMICDGVAGDLANLIPASVFGLAFIETCGPAVKSDNTLIVVCAPVYAGTGLVGKAAATAALAAIPAGTYTITIEGY